MSRLYIYVLFLENNKYYVGKTNNVERRYNEHLNGRVDDLGSEWTKLFKPIKLIHYEEINGGEFSGYLEDIFTKKYMKKYGIDNVRGGTYVNIELNNEVK